MIMFGLLILFFILDKSIANRHGSTSRHSNPSSQNTSESASVERYLNEGDYDFRERFYTGPDEAAVQISHQNNRKKRNKEIIKATKNKNLR